MDRLVARFKRVSRALQWVGLSVRPGVAHMRLDDTIETIIVSVHTLPPK
jgi:hypothetical protein